jgi:hypothetical protein
MYNALVNQASETETVLHRLSLILFNILVFCLLIAPPAYWIKGVFTWFPLLTLDINGDSIIIGGLAMLPVVAGLCWLPSIRKKFLNRTWFWGNLGITLPLLGITFLILIDIFTGSLSVKSTMRWVENLSLLWFIYLFVLNKRPNLSLPLAAACVLQGGIALGQFLKQSDLGLRFLGEKILDPEVSGTIIGVADGASWLRGYGLQAHPNSVGTIVALCLLFLLPQLIPLTGWRKIGLAVVFGVGFIGLLATFSRGALFGFAGGMMIWLWDVVRGFRAMDGETLKQMTKKWLPLGGVYLVVGFGFLITNKNLITSRILNIDVNPLEARSIEARLASARVALEMIANYPLDGVGLDNFLKVAVEISPGVGTVHSIPLLITAELGVLGGLFWLWLAISPFVMARRASQQFPLQRGQIPMWIAPWAAMQIITQVHLQFWLGRHLYVPVLMALLCANLSQPLFQKAGDPLSEQK